MDLQGLSEGIPLIMTITSVLFVVIEWIVLIVLKRVDSNKEGWTNFGSAALTYLPIFLVNTLLTIGGMFFLYRFKLFDLNLEWYTWILAYIAYDFMSFFLHLLSHKVRFLWCIHSVHHSPKEMKTSVAFRGSFAEFLIAPHLILWLPLIGFHPLQVIIVEGVAQLYGVPLHLSNKFFKSQRFLWFQKLFITPRLHRLHHASQDVYLDINYGLTFAIWDKLFGTFQEQIGKDPEYGLTKEIESDKLFISQTDEFKSLWIDIRSTSSFLNKVKYLLYPPGWNHIDGGMSANQIRNEAKLKHV